ncbi:MAG: hypothetical protein RMN24_14680, partial [Anaerolineae bacterium]|nr:hypothetical protein [Anaerolineae bacterium]
IVYRIVITNTGQTTLTLLPLEDSYDTAALQFLSAAPAPDDPTDDGALRWSDLTAPAPGGFGSDLAPGQAFQVQVRFRAKAATTTLVAAAHGESARPAVAAPDTALAPTWIIEVWPTATCSGWQIVFEGSNPAGENWRAKVDGTIIAQGITYGNETVSGTWPPTLDLTVSHTFTAEIYEHGTWLSRSVNFGNCPPPATGSIGDRVFYDGNGSGLPDDGSEPGINGVTLRLYGGACSAATTIAVDAVSMGTTANSTSFTLNHTTGAGPNRLMLVGVSINRQTGTSNDQVTGMTYAGRPLTLVGAVNDTNSTEARVEIWALLDPPIGVAPLVVTFNRANADGAVVGVITFTGVNQTTPYGPFVANHGNGTNLSLVVPSAPGELVFDTAMLRSQALNSAGAGQTQHWRTFFNNRVGAGGSTKPGAATVTMSWTGASAADWALAALALKPATTLGGTPLATTVTAGNGHYLFGSLPAGTYCVDVDESTLPPTYALTTANDPLTVTLSTGQAYTEADFGYRGQCPDGTANIAMTNGVRDETGVTLPGRSSLACVTIREAAGSIGDYVWNDINGNGVQDEPPS